MSEIYEGVVFRADEAMARAAFGDVASSLHLRLVRLAEGVYGAYRVAGRADLFDVPGMERATGQLSARVGKAVALFYDSRGGAYFGLLYDAGRKTREFGEDDEWYVPYGDDGKLLVDEPRLRVRDLHPDEEYDCVFSAIDAALQAIGAAPGAGSRRVLNAFVYDNENWIMEAPGSR
ncbi:hypothetical protein [Paludisphaera soli]|uniref:hypothetical protein n=1 Tax=Paludisphaera soli TaxID=2712865 RepID=UPI0013ED6700|nr:hypothetical protein [Paludisphaera soli]